MDPTLTLLWHLLMDLNGYHLCWKHAKAQALHILTCCHWFDFKQGSHLMQPVFLFTSYPLGWLMRQRRQALERPYLEASQKEMHCLEKLRAQGKKGEEGVTTHLPFANSGRGQWIWCTEWETPGKLQWQMYQTPAHTGCSLELRDKSRMWMCTWLETNFPNRLAVQKEWCTLCLLL